MKKLALILISSFLFSATLRMSFVDEFSNPLPGVRVKIKGEKEFSFFAGESGLIEAELPPGKYRVEARLKGFCFRKGEVEVLPGEINSYRMQLKLGVKRCPEGVQRLAWGEFWPTLALDSLQVLSLSRDVLREEDRFFLNGREYSQGHFPVRLAEPSPVMGSFVALSENRAHVDEERPGRHAYFFSPPGFSLNYEALSPSFKFSGPPHEFYELSMSGGGEYSEFNGAFSVLRLSEGREGLQRKVKSLFLRAGIHGTSLYAMVSRREEPAEWDWKRPYLSLQELPSLIFDQRDFGFSLGEGINSPLKFSLGIETKNSREEISSLKNEVDLSLLQDRPLLNKRTRLRRYHMNLSGHLFLDRLASAQHSIYYGLGFEYMSLWQRKWSENTLLRLSYGDGEVYPGSGLSWWRIYPYEDEDHSSAFYHLSLYLQDTWNFGRFTLFTGIRYDNYHSRYGAGVKEGLSQWTFLNGEGNEDIFSRRLIYSFSGVSTEGFGIRLGFSYKLREALYFEGGISRFARPLDVREMTLFYPYFQGWADVFWRDFNGNGLLEPEEVLNKTVYPPASPSSAFPTEFTDVILLGLRGEIGGVFYGLSFWIENYNNRAAIINTKLSFNPESQWWAQETLKEPGPDGIMGTEDDGDLPFYYFVPTEDVEEFSWAFSPYPLGDLSALSRNIRVYLRRYLKGGYSFFLEAVYSLKTGYWGPSYPLVYSPNQTLNLNSRFSSLSILGGITLVPFRGASLSLFYSQGQVKPYARWVYLITEKTPPFNLQRILLSPRGYETSDPYRTLNLSISYGWKGATLYLRLNNAFNWSYTAQLRGFQGILTEDGRFYPCSSFLAPLLQRGGRELVLGLRVNF